MVRANKNVSNHLDNKTILPHDLGMFSIEHLQARLRSAPSVREVARRSGLSEKTVHRIKAGSKNTSISTANKLLLALDELGVKKPRKVA